MSRLALVFLSALLLASPKIGFAAEAKVRNFNGSMDQVFDATLKSVERNWKTVPSSDRAAGTIEFHTGISLTTWGEDCIALLRDLGKGKIEVAVQSKNSAQLYAWGVGARIARKLFDSIQNEISTSSSESHSSSAVALR